MYISWITANLGKEKNMSVQNEESLKSGLVVGFTQDKKFLFSGKY